MSGKLHHTYATDGDVEQADVRAAVSALADDDLTEKSPVTDGAQEVSVQYEEGDGGMVVGIAVEGHAGEWSKTSEQAIKSAVQSVNGVGELVASEGGYESGSEE